MTPMKFSDPRLEKLDGFRVETDLERERADVGFEISLACDFRLVSETCFYALPEQRLGQIPGSGGSARLQKIVGITRTKDIVMRSRRISAKQAYDWGIATECVPDGKLEGATDALVDELRAFSPLA